MINKRITLKELYLQYEYKAYDIHSKSVPVPYFPKTEITDHKFTLTYKEWRKIIMTYIKYCILYLIDGNLFKIPDQLGTWRLLKRKCKKRRVDLPTTIKRFGEINKTLPKGFKKKVYFHNHHTRGYTPYLKWLRREERLKYKWHWRFNLSRSNWSTISNKLLKDASYINKLISQ